MCKKKSKVLKKYVCENLNFLVTQWDGKNSRKSLFFIVPVPVPGTPTSSVVYVLHTKKAMSKYFLMPSAHITRLWVLCEPW